LKQYLSLAAIISAVIAVDIWTRDTPRWGVAIGVEATLAGLFAIIVAVQTRNARP
jgi:branched-subunit amino acid transport protein